MIKLLFLGSGSAFTVGTNNYQSNILLINEREEKLLIDCGSDLRFSLYDAGFSHLDITDIYVSHLHSDHAGGLEYIGFCTKFDPRCQLPNLYLSKDLASDLWHKTLSGGMSSVSGDMTDLNTFFQVNAIPKDRGFVWSGINFDLIKVTHVDNGYYIMPSYGLFFTIEGYKIFLTTDIQFSWSTHHEYYEKADLIYQDCEISPYPTTVHARYEQLIELPEHIKNKMWLYGYQPGNLPDATKDGFKGFVQCRQTFSFASETDRLVNI